MSSSIRRFFKGLAIVPTGSTAIDAKGEIEVLTSDGKVYYHNGTTKSAVVTANHAETLTNKIIDFETNTISNIVNANIKAGAAIALDKLAALTASRALVSDGSGVVSPSSVTSTELEYVSGVTSAIQTQIDSKQDSGDYITALTGDVTASGPGSAATTVEQVGGVAAADVASGANLANAATDENTSNTIVKRNNNGEFEGDLVVDRIGSSTYKTVQDVHNLFHSAGWVSGGDITSVGDGTVNVTAGTGFIRATNSNLATLSVFDWAASNGLSLGNNATNYIYVDYNSGSPIVTASTTEPSNIHTMVLLGTVYRIGTTVHVNSTEKFTVADHAGQMILMNKATMPYARESGANISGVGTRNIALTAGAFWQGLNRFTTSAFDTSTSDTFVYWYRDGVGGWVSVSTQTQINNTQYDDNSGSLATLTNNRYGVHWVFLETDGEVGIVYGQGDYTLSQAQDSSIPASLPPIFEKHAFIVGKIIIQKSSSSFTSVESSFIHQFTSSLPTDHNTLVGLQGGTAAEYYHLTAAKYTEVVAGVVVTEDGTQTLTGKSISASTNTITDIPASSIVNTPSGNLAAVDVQAALDELQTDVDTRATSSALSDHISDIADAHAASAITNTPSGNLDATTVQAALNELQSDIDTTNNNLSNHITDGVDAHDAAAISNAPFANLEATTVQAALYEIQNDVDDRVLGTTFTETVNGLYSDIEARALVEDLTAHISDTTDAHAGSAITNTPSGNLAATTVQAALDELQTDVDTRATSTALSTHEGLTTAHGVSGVVVGTTDTQALTNKDIDGGTASNSNRITLPKDTLTNLNSLTRKEGTLAYATDTQKPYFDDGASLTEIGSGGSGSGTGFLDLLTNGNAELGATTNWTECTISALSDGFPTAAATISDVANGNFSVTSTGALIGTYSFNWSRDATAAEGVYQTITVPPGLRGKVIRISGKYTAKGTATATGDLAWGIYATDGTTGWIQSVPFKLEGVGVDSQGSFACEWQTNSDSTTYKVVLFQAAAAGGASDELLIDDIFCGEYQKVFGAPVTDWQSYTPTISGLGAGSGTATGKYRRVGDSVQVSVRFDKDATPGSGASYFVIGLPSGLSIDTTKLSSTGSSAASVGSGWSYAMEVAGQYQPAIVVANTTQSTTGVLITDTGTAGDYFNGADIVASSAISVEFFVPVSGWSSSTQMSDNIIRSDDIGQVAWFARSTDPEGYVSADNKTIGISSADYTGYVYKELYEHIWSMAGVSTTSTHPFSISSAKGASASADFAAGKLIRINFSSTEVFIRTKGSSTTLGAFQDDATAKNGLSNSTSGVTGSVGGSDGTHTHTIVSTWIPGVGGASPNHIATKDSPYNGATTLPNAYANTTNSGHGHGFNLTAGAQTITGDVETRPVNVALNAFIKYVRASTPQIAASEVWYAEALTTRTVSTSQTLLLTDGTIIASGAITLTLPPASSQIGKRYRIKKTDASNTITIDTNESETIDGSLTYVLSVQYEAIEITSDGSNWYVI